MNNVYVAKLGKTVGLQGHVKLFIESDFPEQFKKGASFTTNKKETLTILEYNPTRGIVKFENINDVDTAKKLTNSQLFSSYEETRKNCQLDDDEYFWFDLIGCEVHEGEKTLGKIVEIQRYPLNDYLEIKTSKELIEQGLPKVFLLPFIMHGYVLEVDIDKKVVTTQGAFDILENS